MAIFYHLSTLLTNKGNFVPRVPDNRIFGVEESTIKRVCVSKTIEGCFTALGNGDNAYVANFVRRGYYILFRIDTKKLGIERRHVISSRQIYRNGWVPDADVTKEHWITVPFQVPKEDITFIQIRSFKQVQTMAYPYEAVELAKKQYNGDVKSAYKQLYSGSLPCVMETVSLDYQTSKGIAGEERFMFVEGEKEEKEVLDFLAEHCKVELLEWDKGKVHFRLLENDDLRPLFLTNLISSWKDDHGNDDEMDVA